MQQPMVSVPAPVDRGCDYPSTPLLVAPVPGQMSTELFACCTPEVGGGCSHCCFTSFLAPCAVGQNACMLHAGQHDSETTGWMWGGGFCLGMVTGAAGFPLEWVVGMLFRQKVQQSYGIQYDQCENCCLHFFCGPCAIAQVCASSLFLVSSLVLALFVHSAILA